MIDKLIKSHTPFIILEYYEWLKINPKERFKSYQVLYRENNNMYLSVKQTTFSEIKNHLDCLILKKQSKDGKIYEFMEFKEYYDRNKLNWH